MYMDTKHLDPKHRWVTPLFPAIADNPTAIPWAYPTGCGEGFNSGVSNACLVDW